MNNPYFVPDKEISCPGCGKLYGHNGTRVDLYSEECEECAKNYQKTDFVSAEEFIEKVMGYVKLNIINDTPEELNNLQLAFINWLGDGHNKFHGGWMPKYSNEHDLSNLKTTEELYVFFQTKIYPSHKI